MFVIVSRFLVPKGFGGITVCPFIFLRNKKHASDKIYLNHERIHLRQQVEMLVVFFFLWYGIEFILRVVQYKNKTDAYKNIGFEREAYRNESNPDYLASRSFWGFVNYC